MSRNRLGSNKVHCESSQHAFTDKNKGRYESWEIFDCLVSICKEIYVWMHIGMYMGARLLGIVGRVEENQFWAAHPLLSSVHRLRFTYDKAQDACPTTLPLTCTFSVCAVTHQHENLRIPNSSRIQICHFNTFSTRTISWFPSQGLVSIDAGSTPEVYYQHLAL